MLKEQLLKEAKQIDASIELDTIFESVELSDTVKEKFGVVFESAVKKQALALAESHIEAIAEKADALVAEGIETKSQEAEKAFSEKADKFFSHLAEEWLKENAVEVDKGIKSQLFESMFEGLKGLFVEHNVTLPAESVDVVAEMEEELAEAKAETAKLFEAQTKTKADFDAFKREIVIKESTKDLTESQKEKVASLIEGLDYSDSFETKLQSIVEFASTKTKIEEKPLVESQKPVDQNLNFVVESAGQDGAEQIDPLMASFVKSASFA